MAKHVEIDLPEPRRPTLTLEQRADRERRLIVTLTTLAIAYSLLHKVLVPLILKATVLRGSAYAHVDTWWAHSAALLACLYFLPQTSRLLSLLAGAGIVYGGVEVAEVYLGHFPGWLAISRLLSSLPIAGLCIALLTSGRFPVRSRYAWAGAFVAVILLYVSIRVLQ